MMNRSTKSIGEICRISTGKYDVNHNIEDGKFPFFTCALNPFRSNTFSFDDEVIILPGNGANVGEVLYYKGKLEAYQRTYVLHSFNANVKYVYYYFKWLWKRVLQGKQFGSATNYIRFNNISDFKIPLPPLPIQQKIADALDKADAIRQHNKKILEKYDQLAQSVFLEMFGDPVRNPYNFPKGKIRDIVAEVKYGTSKKASSNGKYPYLRMNNITYLGQMDYSNLKYIDLAEKEKDKYTVCKGDLLFNRTNSKELVGKTAVYNREDDMAIAGYLLRVRTNNKANTTYISAFLNSKYGKATLLNMCKNIVGMANINAQEFQEIDIIIPPKDLQIKYKIIIQSIDQIKSSYIVESVRTEDLFQSLLQKSFKGELFN